MWNTVGTQILIFHKENKSYCFSLFVFDTLPVFLVIFRVGIWSSVANCLQAGA